MYIQSTLDYYLVMPAFFPIHSPLSRVLFRSLPAWGFGNSSKPVTKISVMSKYSPSGFTSSVIVSCVYFRQGPNTTYIYCFSWLPLKRFKILLWSFTSIFVHFKFTLYVLTLKQQTWQFHSYANFVTWYFCFPGDETLHGFFKKRTEPALIIFFTAGV